MAAVAIIDYGAGNVQSLRFALLRLGFESELTSDPEKITSASHVIFPGQGEARTAMIKLRSTGLHKLIPTLTQPVLGICLGMQLFCRYSHENDTLGLGIINQKVYPFPPSVKRPQIGWNQIYHLTGRLFEGLNEGTFVYLVHSYYVPKDSYTTAVSHYGLEYAASLSFKNFNGLQFHPEKSSTQGSKILMNFLKM